MMFVVEAAMKFMAQSAMKFVVEAAMVQSAMKFHG